MNRIDPEILAPGGSFNSAIHALKSGADAVYIGLTSFSARKSATNFTLDQLRRLKTYCAENSKKIYVAINTLLTDYELNDVYPLLKQLEEIEVDAIIVQDLGLAHIIKTNTNLTLHASTQLAVHNIHGVQSLIELGFSRAVLSRELSLGEIKNIKVKFPHMELEIFIHGALCYGFSGLCLASSNILGRSANRGECGQICRTWFNINGKKEYSFSLNDLSLKEKILELRDIGVESLKIEGRMKGPGYVASTVELYREILNGNDFKKPLSRSLTEFNRTGQDAYLTAPKGQSNINSYYPGHLGLNVGKIVSVSKNSFTAQMTESVNNRDGLLILGKTSPYTPVKFAANIEGSNGNKVTFRGTIPNNSTGLLYKISDHDKHLKDEKPQSYKPWKSTVNLNIAIEQDKIRIKTQDLEYSFNIELEAAKNPVDLKRQFNKIFLSGGETNYSFPCIITNNSEMQDPFIPSSKLKEIRKQFQKKYINDIPAPELEERPKKLVPTKKFIANKNRLPFITVFSGLDIEKLNKVDDRYLLPLAPVVFDSEMYLLELKEFLNNHRSNYFTIGLNNISQISYIDNLPTGADFYTDYGLYSINSFSSDLLSKQIKNLQWTTQWIESNTEGSSPPLFISRTCFKAQKNGCPKDCNKKFEKIISQNGKNYKVVVENCISYTLLI